MDENLSRGYVQFGKARGLNELKFNTGFTQISPPEDKYKFVLLSLVLAGMGFLLPYNSFIIAADYFQARYPGTTVIFDMSIVYIAVALVAVLINNVLVEVLPLHKRILFGYTLSLVTLNFVVLCEIWWELFGVASYAINLAAVAVVSFGCTVQQSSFYGYTSMLPSRYTQAVMAGESAAGFWVSLSRILTKSIVVDERKNTSMFFISSFGLVTLSAGLYQLLHKTKFVQFYINLYQERNRITLEPTEERDIIDNIGQPKKGQYGVLKLKTSPTGDSSSTNIELTTSNETYAGFSFSNPVYEPNAPSNSNTSSTGPTYKVEDVITIRTSFGSNDGTKPLSGFKKGLSDRWEITKLIYPYMLSIGFAYTVTLMIYPGIMTEIISCKFKSWMPVILMAAFNVSDLIGKMLTLIPYEWTRKQLICFSSARFILAPLFLLCAIPRRAEPILPGEGFPIFLSSILGLTNGIFGSVPMIQAPSKVPDEHRELTGNIMTLLYISGLFLGSLLAYMLKSVLGETTPINRICDIGGQKLRKAISMATNNSTVSSILSTSTTTVVRPTKTTWSPNVKTTTMLATIFSTTILTSTSLDVSNITAKNISTTALPNFLLNATLHMNNTILHH